MKSDQQNCAIMEKKSRFRRSEKIGRNTDKSTEIWFSPDIKEISLIFSQYEAILRTMDRIVALFS
jgi:hypothetical protein